MSLLRGKMWGHTFRHKHSPSTTSTSRLRPVPEIKAMAQSVQSAVEVIAKNAQFPTWPLKLTKVGPCAAT